ncbi:GNAT family N-acetyltransferase [Acetobacter sacchari]|uniref:GNAT family N-acetyltransferase n=1 Tax=Acetobacter sacchari TaxID=2661687 RepID=A0ABS3LRY2_9PROT|nr:GNAT family N-acetyltransferase [Acetobacter sacchari]MBO1358650.1 GNAT family N-acetyltransferase [Acetobacter sacchari]
MEIATMPSKSPDWALHRLGGSPDQREHEITSLAQLLIEIVADNGSVGFLHPLSMETAREFWSAALDESDKGRRTILGAMEGANLVGTVSISISTPENQPHRAEIMKLMTRKSHARRGVATALMVAAEKVAVEHGRTHLTLDTAEQGGAGELYERLGYFRAGSIPDYALKPHGGLTATVIYWKLVGCESD